MVDIDRNEVHVVDAIGSQQVIPYDVRAGKFRGPEVGETWIIERNVFGQNHWAFVAKVGATDEDMDTARFRGTTIENQPPADGEAYVYDAAGNVFTLQPVSTHDFDTPRWFFVR
jgi:hypothetical protein